MALILFGMFSNYRMFIKIVISKIKNQYNEGILKFQN